MVCPNPCSSELWHAFLTNTIVTRALQLSKERCPACKAMITSPILHIHLQHSLLEKIGCYLNELKGEILNNINDILVNFKFQLEYEDAETDFMFWGKTFIHFATAESLYYGRYVTEETDKALVKQDKPSVSIMNKKCEKIKGPPKKKMRKEEPANLYTAYNDDF